MSEAEIKKTLLTQQDAIEIAGAVARLDEIKNLSALSQTKQIEAEACGLVEFLSKKFIDNAGEFLGCWFAVRLEYEPLIRGLAPVLRRLQPKTFPNEVGNAPVIQLAPRDENSN